MKKKNKLICLSIILIIIGIVGFNVFNNYFTDKGKRKQCVINYIKEVNKGSIPNKYASDDLIDLIDIDMIKEYKIVNVEEYRKLSDKGYGGYVVANVVYISDEGEEKEKQLAFLPIKKNKNDKYKIYIIISN